MTALLAAVDVGTGSARAGIFRPDGALLGRAEQPIETRRLSSVMAAQDSARIWQACARALRGARAEAAAPREAVRALAFDATCSLAFRAADGAPVGILPGEPARWDTILWLDHRAAAEAAEFTATGHPALRHLGGTMSPEMAPPKLLWVKRHMPEAWTRTGRIHDLADFLAWQATGSGNRSRATLACKWCHLGEEGWPRDLFARVGLTDLLENAGITAPPVPVGQPVGHLTPGAAAELDLPPGLPVGAGLVDAYAGALGVLGAERAGDVALIAGTSTCLLTLAREARFVPAAWGPFADVVFPGTWALEVGQSASGALLDRLLTPPGAMAPTPGLRERVMARLRALRAATPDLAPELHVLPDFLGNRAPLGDPAARATITGLDLGGDLDSLCRLYWRTAVALALGLREMVAHLRAHGIGAERLLLAGGHGRDEMLTALYADATGLPLVAPRGDPVLLGTAMAAGVAAGLFPDTRAAARAMGSEGQTRAPDPARSGWLERDARAFALLRRHRAELEALLRAQG
ncbi:FGGY family pentulose kinase [Amaricoccus solimangrovi]|uniref:Ribulokinase n=1 Tax=Amaricoccus solimangrovi TaxID=2589815 RepID=A0A501WFZ9_9RHOB|nr:FGGY family pentulose kinase [Amaricoccus solimangrovi]TPE48328.1 ribulokinase [Amaricoccus solimangrovi]